MRAVCGWAEQYPLPECPGLLADEDGTGGLDTTGICPAHDALMRQTLREIIAPGVGESA